MNNKEKYLIQLLARAGSACLQNNMIFKASECFRLINNIVNDAPEESIVNRMMDLGLIEKKVNNETSNKIL